MSVTELIVRVLLEHCLGRSVSTLEWESLKMAHEVDQPSALTSWFEIARRLQMTLEAAGIVLVDRNQAGEALLPLLAQLAPAFGETVMFEGKSSTDAEADLIKWLGGLDLKDVEDEQLDMTPAGMANSNQRIALIADNTRELAGGRGNA